MKQKLFAAILITAFVFAANNYAQVEVNKIQSIVKPTYEHFISPDGNVMVGGNKGGVALFDISDITNPVYITGIALNPDTYCRSAAFYGDCLFLSTGVPYGGTTAYWDRHYYALYVYNIADIENPVLVKEIADFNPFSAENLWIYEDKLIFHYGLTIRVYDLADVDEMNALSEHEYHTFDYSSDHENVFKFEDHLYVFHDHAIKAISISDINNIHEVGRLRFNEEILYEFGYYNFYDPVLQADEDYLIALGDQFVHKIDIGNPSGPTLISSVPIANEAKTIEVKNGFAYIPFDKSSKENEEYYISIYDVRGNEDPPVLINSIEVDEHVTGLTAVDNSLLAVSEGSYYLYDISDPAVPEYISQSHFGGFNWFYIYNDTYVGSKGKALVYQEYDDYINFAPLEYHNNELSDIGAHVVSDNYLYATVNGNGISIYDITDKMNPVRVDTVTTYTGTHSARLALSANGKLLFTFEDDGVVAYDVENKLNPVIVSANEFGNAGYDLTVVDDVLVVNTRYKLLFYEINEEAKTVTALSELSGGDLYGGFVWTKNGVVYVDKGYFIYKIDLSDKNNITETKTELQGNSPVQPTERVVIDNYSVVTRLNELNVYYCNPDNNELTSVFYLNLDIDGNYDATDLQLIEDKLFDEREGIYDVYQINIVTDIEDEPLTEVLPETFELHQNYPNPFNPSTVISFNLPNSGWTELSVYDPLGRKVETLISGDMSAGAHQVTFNAEGYPTGVYIYTLRYNTLQKGLTSKSIKMLLLK